MPRQFGVSVASLAPYCLMGQDGFRRAIDMALEARFAGLQLLPIRGYGSIWPEAGDYVMSYEEVWNCGPLGGALLRFFHLAGENQPTLKDWMLFGGAASSYHAFQRISRLFPEAIFVDHKAGPNAFEIHPELDLAEVGYKAYTKLVLDTHHLRRERRDGKGGPVTYVWDEFIQHIARAICLIHVQPTIDAKAKKDELADLLAGRTCELTRLLEFLHKRTSCDMILEVPPIVATPQRVIERLSAIRESVLQYIN